MHSTELAQHIAERASQQERFVVAIAGPPGAGKSTIAGQLLGDLTELGEAAVVVPMDGFHLDNIILESRNLVARKGAPQTFDADGFVNLIRRLVDNPANDIVIPVFDRKRDLAIAGAEVVATDVRIVLCEGNYLLLKQPPWSELHGMWDLSILIDPGIDVIQQRLVTRWLDHGLDRDQAVARAQGNDMPNARLVLDQSVEADLTLKN